MPGRARRVGVQCPLVDAEIFDMSVCSGSASTRHERDFEGDELTLKMSGIEAAVRCVKVRP